MVLARLPVVLSGLPQASYLYSNYQRPVRVNQARDVVLGVPDIVIPVAARRHPDQLPISIVDLHSFLHSVPDKHFLFPNHSPEADSSSVKKAQPLPFITKLQKLCFL